MVEMRTEKLAVCLHKNYFWPIPFRLTSAAVLQLWYTDEHIQGHDTTNGNNRHFLSPMPQKYFCTLWRLYEILLMVYFIDVHIWRVSQPKLAWIWKEKRERERERDQTTGRGLFVSMFNYFLAIRPSIHPTFRWSVRPSNHVSMPLQSRDYRTPSHVSENCTRLADLLELWTGTSQGLYLHRKGYINTETLQICIHTLNVFRIHSPNNQAVEGGRSLEMRGRCCGYVCVCKTYREHKFNVWYNTR